MHLDKSSNSNDLTMEQQSTRLARVLAELGVALCFEVDIVTQVRIDDRLDQDSRLPPAGTLAEKSWAATAFNKFVPRPQVSAGLSVRRPTPRVSLIFVLPEDQVVEPDRLALRLSTEQHKDVDVTIACAGQPSNLDALKRTAATARFLVAPRGTTAEDLREFAMEQTPGDIVNLLDASHLSRPLEQDQRVTC